MGKLLDVFIEFCCQFLRCICDRETMFVRAYIYIGLRIPHFKN